ncbi:MAG: rubredoxin [Cytophagaceae bacterium]|nr:rubredoxin [Cytophagaceae bacterium]
MSKTILRFIIPGGIVSPGELRRIANTANYFGIDHIHIGERQDLLLKAKKNQVKEIYKRLENSLYHFTAGKGESKNIITSFSVRNLFHSTPWVTEGSYLEILSSFTHHPKLKINITDPQQSCVPLFTGDLNFVASHQDDYWYLFIRFSEKVEMWPVLVDSNEVSALSLVIEQFLLKNKNFNIIQLQTHIYNLRNWNFRIIDKPLNVKPVRFPIYEGFYPMGERFWLGVYHSENSFPIGFIESLCALCAQTNVGSINLTSWNSLLIKNIDEKDIPLWENLLGKYGINTGHSQFELNWQLPEMDHRADVIKKYVLRAFEKRVIRTAGLIFGIRWDAVDPGTSIIITKKVQLKLFGIEILKTYGIKYKKDFDPNSTEIIPFADGLKRRNLPEILAYLTAQYYDNLNKQSKLPEPNQGFNFSPEKISSPKNKQVHQCKECLTIYDPAEGDTGLSIAANTPFENLPADYKCPVCEAAKASFVPVQTNQLMVK